MSMLFPAGYQFLNINARAVASGTVTFYDTGTTTPRAIYSDSALSVVAANPYSLDAAGRMAVNLYGSGEYTVVVKDATGATVFSRDDVFGWGDGAPYYARTAAEVTAGVTPTDYGFEPGNVRRYGAVGDGVTDDTTAFQNAALVGIDLIIPKVSAGGYIVSEVTRLTRGARGIDMPKITMDKAITYTGAALNDGAAQIFRWLNNSTDCEITGIHFVGDFDGTTGTDTEHAHNVAISASSNKRVHGCVFDLPYGDGVYIGKYNWGEADASAVNMCENISVYNNRFINPRRCAVAFVSADNCNFRNNVATKANTFVGLIDLEPNTGDSTYVDGVDIYDNDLFCVGRIINFYATTDDSVKNVRCYRNKLNGESVAFDFSSASTNAVYMSGIEITDNTTPDAATATLDYFILARNDVRGLVLRNNVDLDSGRWVIIKNTNCVIDGNIIDRANTLQQGQGIEMRDCDGYQITNNTFKNLDRVLVTWGCILILKTLVDATPVSKIAIRGNVCRSSHNFIVARHATEVGANSLKIEDADISGNTVSATNAFMIANPASVALTRVRLDPNNVVSGTMTASQAYDVYGNVTSVSGTPAYIGQRALVAGALYVAQGVSGAADWVHVTAFQGSKTHDWGSLADGAGESTTVTVTGAALGDFAEASHSVDLAGCILSAYVSATDTVTVRLQNETGAGPVDIVSGTLRARVRKA